MSIQLTEETAIESGDTDLICTKEQFEQLDQHVKRRFAAAANSDEINGKSVDLEYRSFFVRQRTLNEYAED